MKGERRIVVTGTGVVSPVGSTVEEAWNALLAGISGIDTIPIYDSDEFRCHFGGIVRGLNADLYLTPKEQQRVDPYCIYAIAAAQQAIEEAKLTEGSFEPSRVGVLVSSGIGGLHSMEEHCKKMQEKGPRGVSPLAMTMMIGNMASGHIAIRHNFQGPNFGLVSACATGLHSIGEAAWIIRRGDADVMLAGGSECVVVPFGHAAFCSMRAYSCRNDDPKHASRPFDATRDGFVPAEGAGVLVLEDMEHAKKRGAVILAEVTGYGATSDAFHITAPREDGTCAARAISIALEHAGLTPADLGYVNAHGTSTHLNDLCETNALKLALGKDAYRVPISSTKSVTGHMLGAAGGFESVVCVKALMERKAPGTMNLNTPDPQCDLDYMPNCARELPELRHSLKMNMGFGGHNAAVIFSHFEE